MRQVAIIGAGIGAEHLDGYRAVPEHFKVRTLCDMNLERARIVVGDADIAVVDSVQDVLADDAIDIVDVCLPPHLHFDVTLAALKAGKHVVCEKPLVRSVREVDALIDEASLAGRQIFPVFQYRYGTGLNQLMALKHAGLTGKPYMASLETHWNRDSQYYAVSWRGSWTGESGGAVLGHAIHNHDLLTYVFGPIASLSAITTTRVNPIEVEDCAVISFAMENGALATSSVTLGAATDTTRLRFCFEGLTATSGSEPYAPGNGAWRFEARGPTKQSQIDAVLAQLPAAKPTYAGFFEAVALALDGYPGRDVTLADGRRSIELVTAVYQAARTGKRITLPLGKDAALYTGWQPKKGAVNSLTDKNT